MFSDRLQSCFPSHALVIVFVIFLTGSPISLVRRVTSAASHVSEFDIVEELSPRSFVGTVRTNPDVADLLNGTSGTALRFNFRYPNGPATSLFTIDDRSGDIKTGRRIDREQLCPSSTLPCYLSFDVTVLPVRYFRILRVRIRVDDLNDNVPAFVDPRLNVEVRENAAPGTVVTLPVAEDADAGENGVLRYEMTPLPDPSADYPFRLTVRHAPPQTSSDDDEPSASGPEVLLTITGRLDREARSSYQLRLTAFDGGRPTAKSGSIDITIVVLDANDNSPRFDAPSYEADVVENQPHGTTIVRVHATDSDDGLNGEIVYRIADQSPTSASGSVTSATGGDGPFAVDNRTGVVYVVGELDAERHAGYQLTVVAADRGIGSLPAYARVTVRVADANDNRPTIVINSLTEYGRVEIIENSAPGAFVAFVTARDADSGKNGAVDCSLTAGNNRFRLEPVAGSEGGGDYKLTTTTTFNREASDRHFVTLRCADNGRPPLSSTAEVEIRIGDENDNAPTFDGGSLHAVAVNEGNYVGVVIAAMNATDLDSGTNALLTYRMQPVDDTPEGAAEIDAQTGSVYATISYDYEKRREYRYRVTVVDGATSQLSATASLIVRVVDINDERPVFDRPSYHFSTSENRPAGTLIGNVRASDADVTPSFNRIVYSIVQGHGSFALDPVTGALTTARRLDREDTAVYELTVRASNDVGPTGGSSAAFAVPQSTVSVVIRVDDENDNAPTVHFPTVADRLVVDVPVSATAGTLLTRIEATDPDEGPNGALVYALANGNEEGLFAIDRDTGTLTTARRLFQIGHDGSQQMPAVDTSRSYRLVVTVRDRGTPERLAVADLTIAVNCSAAAVRLFNDRSSDPDGPRTGEIDDGSLSSTSSSSSSFVGALFFDSSHRVIVLATVVAGSIIVIIVIIAIVAIGVGVCRWRRRRRRKLSDRRHDEWLRQQASTACSDAGCSCSDRRSTASNRSCSRTLHRHDSGSLVGSSLAASSLRGGGRMTVLVPQSMSMSLQRAGPWASTVVDHASCTDRDDNDGDESDNDDVPLSTGLTSSSSHHGCRYDNDRSQTVGLLTGVVDKSSTDSNKLLPTSLLTPSQRTTPDVLRQAAATADNNGSSANCSAISSAVDPATPTARSNMQQRTPRTPSGRYHYNHQQQHQRRSTKSPSSGSLGLGYRPSSASSTTAGGKGLISAGPRRHRAHHRHTSKSDVEMSDRNADGDSESEFSESTTCRDSGMDHSEDSDNVAPPPPPAPAPAPPSTATTATTIFACAQPPPPPPRITS